jgi:hypothetical protein
MVEYRRCGEQENSRPQSDEVQKQLLLVPSVALVDFGTVSRSGHRQIEFELQNPGTEAVELTKVRTSCECLRLVPPTFVVSPGERVTLIAIVDFSDDPGFSGALRLEANGFGTKERPAFLVQFNVRVQ